MSEQKSWTYDEEIRAAAEKYIADNELTQAEFAGKLAGKFHSTRVNKYLNLDKPGAEPEKGAPDIEAAIRAFLRHVARGIHLQASLYENSVTNDVATVLKLIRKTGDIALVYGDGGEGKTCGATLFCRDNPDTIFVTAKHPYACADWAIMRMVFEEFSQSTASQWDGKGDRWAWLEKSLRGTERLIIFDDAELMYVSAFRWAFSLSDATGCPMAFFGNDRVIEKIRQSDLNGKMISRIGIVHHARMKDDVKESAKQLISQFAPASDEELVEEVMHTMGELGHSRRARKQLILASNIHDGMRDKNWLRAFALAGKKLISAQNGRGA